MHGARAAVEAMWAAPAEARWLRAVLRPASWAYGAGASLVGAAWDHGLRGVVAPALPTVSVGNLSVGGTGKTPIASWIAGWFAERGVRPAIVLRGYGDDEPLVHRRLLPSVIVVATPDRAAGIRDAAARGAQVAVLDDGFQHRRVGRAVDLVLLGAEQVVAETTPGGAWRPAMLPAGPYREPIGALARASAIVLTRKDASDETMVAARRAVARVAGLTPLIEIALSAGALVPVAGTQSPPRALAGAHVLAIAGIGAPRRFAEQLRQLGAEVSLRAFPDHHAFDARDAAALAAEATGTDGAVCTLKDAVKLERLWPASGPSLSYLSQQCRVDAGSERLESLLGAVRAMVPQ